MRSCPRPSWGDGRGGRGRGLDKAYPSLDILLPVLVWRREGRRTLSDNETRDASMQTLYNHRPRKVRLCANGSEAATGV